MNRARGVIHYIYILILSLISVSALAQSENKVRIHGRVMDSSTKEALPYVSVRISRSTLGCSTDNNGYYSFFAPQLRDTLIVSSLGYGEKRIILSNKTRLPINIYLKPENLQLSEITIKPKKEKYKRKNNPAVILAKTIIEKRDDNAPENKPYYSRDRHEKLNVALNNFNSSQESHFGKKFSFLDNYIDTSLISGKPILHVSARELIGTDYYRKEPKRHRQYFFGRIVRGVV